MRIVHSEANVYLNIHTWKMAISIMTVYWIYAGLNDIRIHILSKALDAICAPMAFQGEFSHPLQFVRIKTLWYSITYNITNVVMSYSN